jgi:DNA sulfur modification protein DndC
LNQRKGILDALEACITHTFYENEDDALQYYMDRLDRKRSFGGKYDEKFFAHVKGEGEEFDQETVAEDASLIGDESE